MSRSPTRLVALRRQLREGTYLPQPERIVDAILDRATLRLRRQDDETLRLRRLDDATRPPPPAGGDERKD